MPCSSSLDTLAGTASPHSSTAAPPALASSARHSPPAADSHSPLRPTPCSWPMGPWSPPPARCQPHTPLHRQREPPFPSPRCSPPHRWRATMSSSVSAGWRTTTLWSDGGAARWKFARPAEHPDTSALSRSSVAQTRRPSSPPSPCARCARKYAEAISWRLMPSSFVPRNTPVRSSRLQQSRAISSNLQHP